MAGDNISLEREYKLRGKSFKYPTDRLGPVGMITLASKISSSRMIITNHNGGHVVNLRKPDPPLMYTGREKVLGELSSMRKVNEDKREVVDIIRKNAYKYHLIVYCDKKNEYDIIVREEVEEMNEGFSTKYNNEFLDNLEIGDKIKPGEVYKNSNSFDKHGNYMMGRNLNVGYGINVLTQEDGILLMNNADKMLSIWRTKRFKVSFGFNDLPLAIYKIGSEFGDYKAFPQVGEKIKNGILVAKRTIDKSTDIRLVKDKYLKRIESGDVVTYANGKVIDIEIYTNAKIRNLKEVSAYHEINELYKKQMDYYMHIYKTLKEIIDGADEKGYTYSRALSDLYADAKDRITTSSHACDYGDREITTIDVEFTVMYKQSMCPGDKMAGRCGNKGVITGIIPPELSWKTEDGRPFHVLLDGLGICARLNPEQFDEQAYNDMGRSVTLKMAEFDGNVPKQLKILMEFIKSVNPDDYVHLREFIGNLNYDEKVIFVKKTIKHGIRIQVDPIETASLEDFEKLYDKYPTEPTKIVFADGTKSLNSLIVAPMYLWRLKQLSDEKYSVRGRGTIHPMTHLPSKSSGKANGTDRFTNTAVQIGIYETLLLLLCKSPYAIASMMACHSTSVSAREEMSRLYYEKVTPENMIEYARSINSNKKNTGNLQAHMHTLSIGIDIEYEENPNFNPSKHNDFNYRKSYPKRIVKDFGYDSYDRDELLEEAFDLIEMEKDV